MNQQKYHYFFIIFWVFYIVIITIVIGSLRAIFYHLAEVTPYQPQQQHPASCLFESAKILRKVLSIDI